MTSLVLTRKTAEGIVIGDDILVEVDSISRGQVRLRITAPPSVQIMREELVHRKELPFNFPRKAHE